jgi:methyltransferase (TIGR00027 family)
MEEGRPSSTAMMTAMLRAAHLLWDDPPKIFEDPFALGLSGCANEAVLRAKLDGFLADLAAKADRSSAQAVIDTFRFAVVLRSRYVEDELAQALKQGVSQYVILGAGLDSFAYRVPDVAKTLRVFEVDHPSTQAWKRARLQELGVTIPPNLVFVPLDFQKQSLTDGLRNRGYRSDTAGFFSWLGVTWYLTREAIFDTLRAVASMAPGTEIIIQYHTATPSEEGGKKNLLRNWAAELGEPFVTVFDPTELEEQVRKLGFAEVRRFGQEEANTRYFANRSDGLRLRARVHFMTARV